MILRSGRFRSFSAAYSVVVFPEPVGPVTRMMPLGRRIRPLKCLKSSSAMPSCRRPTLMLSLSSSRITIDWPWLVGSTLTRRSSSFSPSVTLIRPSWGRRRSAISILARILMRDSIAPSSRRGGVALDQHAVDPVADPDAVFERLDVNVRGPQLHRLADDHLHQPNDRCAGFVEDSSELVAGSGLGEVDRRVGEFLQHRVGAFPLAAIVTIDRVDDVLARSQRDIDLAVQDEPQLVQRVEIERIADDDLQRPSSSASGRIAFSRATDSGTNSMTPAGS